ncbi:hypothetical protein [Halolamina pelagica]|uniref:hypothetical protein n=1 Tax=Halolamina pelagica TaxID=699431 RepID=UPI00166FA601|nr:hypothetical protein [Halolamina pelagica]
MSAVDSPGLSPCRRASVTAATVATTSTRPMISNDARNPSTETAAIDCRSISA